MSKNYFEPGEWYHCYNRGVDKRTVFLDHSYYERFLALLYLCNDTNSHVRMSETQGLTLDEIVKTPRENTFVDIGSYCLMANHFHLLLREKEAGGISEFMRKVSTAYTMYFNLQSDRTGSLFGGTFKSKHISDDLYLKRVVNYIHANPAELIEHGWKLGIIRSYSGTEKFLKEYCYSSLPDYVGVRRCVGNILNRAALLQYYENGEAPTIHALFADAQDFADIEYRIQG